MKPIILADKTECTACGACMLVCPKNCIHMEPDELDCLYPVIDQDACVACGKCAHTCPAIGNNMQLSMPVKAYAAWNLDPQIRRTAASGGIASAIYSYCLKNGIQTYGVHYEPGGTAKYIPVCSQEDADKCRNSKYVFSDITTVVGHIREGLAQGKQVILPGLPCQLAAVRTILGPSDGLTLVDIVCHGTCPDAYLNQHIANIQQKKGKTTQKACFRDPEFGTNKFVFSLKNGGTTFYKKKVHADDTYQLGYHKMLDYRENCYYCSYAQPRRIGDLTISDFSGLGRLAPFAHDRVSVSCVLTNTDKGQVLFETLVGQGLITAEERPLDEALKYERQLQAPSKPHNQRSVFVDLYKTNGNFDMAARKALKKDILRNNLRNGLCVDFWKKVAAKLLPGRIKKLLKKVGK